MDKFSLEDVNPHSFPIIVRLTFVDENLPVGADLRWPTLSSQALKYCWYFFYRIFFSTLLVYQREILYQVLECVLVL